jgi:AcrR family transcriptional regulator
MPRRLSLNARKQPAQARSRETVAVILEAAARILEKDGFAGYNTNAVATRAGVSVGSIYQYFPNKDALTLALIEQFERELSETVRLAAARVPRHDLRESLKAFVRALIEAHGNRPELNRLLELEEDRLRRFLPDFRAARELQAVMSRLLREHRSELAVTPNAETVNDVITITKAMVDATFAESSAPAGAERRILRAIEGYLRWA